MTTRDPLLAQTLRAFDLPDDEAVAGWLEQLERFYREHGGERRYAECLALLAECRAQLALDASPTRK